jgi:hypothetical protein
MQVVMQDLNANRVGKSLNLEAFRQEVVHRFEDIGWRVQVNTFETTEPGVYAFDFELQGRCNPHPEGTDWERFGWEVRNDTEGVEPDKKDAPKMPFNPEMLHSGQKHKCSVEGCTNTTAGHSH